jgi:hypothetical protein
MPRPTSKITLIEATAAERRTLDKLLEPLSDEAMTLPGVCDTWSVKDILAHLLAWQQMVLSWYRAGARGEPVKTPADDLKWSETPILNQRIYERYRDVPLNAVKEGFEASHKEVLAVLDTISDEALTTPGYYPWTKSTTLLSYFVSCTSSHYHWASGEIKRWVKGRG